MTTQQKDFILYKSTKYYRNNFEPSTFLGKTTIIPGTSGSGKSFMLNSVLRSISNHVSTLMVFSGTAVADKSFPMEKYTHQSMIYKTLDINSLKKAIDKHEELVSNYIRLTEWTILEAAANYLDRRYERFSTNQMKRLNEKILNKKEELKALKTPTKQPSKPVIDKYKEEIIVMYKRYISLYKDLITRRGIIVSNATVCDVLRYIQFIPYIAIVLNDLTDEYAALTNKEKSVFNAILNKGRHFGITLIMLIHTWNGFGTQIRNSAHNIIFTTSAMASTYSTLQKMKGSELKTFNDAIECIISRDRALPEEERKHTCVLFDRPMMKCYYIQADSRGKQVYVGIPYFTKLKSR